MLLLPKTLLPALTLSAALVAAAPAAAAPSVDIEGQRLVIRGGPDADTVSLTVPASLLVTLPMIDSSRLIPKIRAVMRLPAVDIVVSSYALRFTMGCSIASRRAGTPGPPPPRPPHSPVQV